MNNKIKVGIIKLSIVQDQVLFGKGK